MIYMLMLEGGLKNIKRGHFMIYISLIKLFVRAYNYWSDEFISDRICGNFVCNPIYCKKVILCMSIYMLYQ